MLARRAALPVILSAAKNLRSFRSHGPQRKLEWSPPGRTPRPSSRLFVPLRRRTAVATPQFVLAKCGHLGSERRRFAHKTCNNCSIEKSEILCFQVLLSFVPTFFIY